ncbi:ABC transporter permease [Pyruvatibacter mobilis]|jgi:ABC-2 type transport system permease protein|uniref:Transport permease protein n=1 Tax=Pyruvatibacter mobilis TaxID=1712261 RepID=A0A845Q8L9_9HYPH|nr:ABC transporter permease [Pyruvatibacter mobilis]NBG94797.1 ABC transporter permease [Pyruvatibacter mobilis]QJD75984.1 ABC transporter permease [Pyruvatibacter mobilis]GGD20171.1 transport permease protein [Pyruvatibacter mobilis]
MSDVQFEPGERRFGSVNWLGLWTLYLKEVRRFMKVFTQTVAGPVVTALLFFAVFAVAMGRADTVVAGVPYLAFLGPGLIMMTVIQNAFANTSSSILVSKVQGNVVDMLMPPLSPGELNAAFAFGGVTRGVVVALASAIVISFFAPMGVAHWWAVLFFVLAASLALALMGVLAGVWAEKFDHMQAVTNFIITPLAFLSGTFYSVERLPEVARGISSYNPFFYMIDGFRYGFTGHADGSITTGVIVLVALNAVLWGLCHYVFKKGYRLKA